MPNLKVRALIFTTYRIQIVHEIFAPSTLSAVLSKVCHSCANSIYVFVTVFKLLLKDIKFALQLDQSLFKVLVFFPQQGTLCMSSARHTLVDSLKDDPCHIACGIDLLSLDI